MLRCVLPEPVETGPGAVTGASELMFKRGVGGHTGGFESIVLSLFQPDTFFTLRAKKGRCQHRPFVLLLAFGRVLRRGGELRPSTPTRRVRRGQSRDGVIGAVLGINGDSIPQVGGVCQANTIDGGAICRPLGGLQW